MNHFLDKILEVLDEYADFPGPRSEFTIHEIKQVMAEYAMACLHDTQLAIEAAAFLANCEQTFKEWENRNEST